VLFSQAGLRLQSSYWDYSWDYRHVPQNPAFSGIVILLAIQAYFFCFCLPPTITGVYISDTVGGTE
jgi:hypothetical protein